MGFVTESQMEPDYINLFHEEISFSKMTFSHQMIRIFVLEQIYRSLKIINNEPYHNE